MEANVALMEAFVPWANSQSWIERYFWNQAVSLVPWELKICVNLAQSAGSGERASLSTLHQACLLAAS